MRLADRIALRHLIHMSNEHISVMNQEAEKRISTEDATLYNREMRMLVDKLQTIHEIAGDEV